MINIKYQLELLGDQYRCPEQPDIHKFNDKYCFIQHLTSCRSIGLENEYYICRKNPFHIYQTEILRDDHEKQCEVDKNKLENSNHMIITGQKNKINLGLINRTHIRSLFNRYFNQITQKEQNIEISLSDSKYKDNIIYISLDDFMGQIIQKHNYRKEKNLIEQSLKFDEQIEKISIFNLQTIIKFSQSHEQQNQSEDQLNKSQIVQLIKSAQLVYKFIMDQSQFEQSYKQFFRLKDNKELVLRIKSNDQDYFYLFLPAIFIKNYTTRDTQNGKLIDWMFCIYVNQKHLKASADFFFTKVIVDQFNKENKFETSIQQQSNKKNHQVYQNPTLKKNYIKYENRYQGDIDIKQQPYKKKTYSELDSIMTPIQVSSSQFCIQCKTYLNSNNRITFNKNICSKCF